MAQLYRSIVTWRDPTVEEREAGPGWIMFTCPNLVLPVLKDCNKCCTVGSLTVVVCQLDRAMCLHSSTLPSAIDRCVDKWLDTNTMLLMHSIQAVQVFYGTFFDGLSSSSCTHIYVHMLHCWLHLKDIADSWLVPDYIYMQFVHSINRANNYLLHISFGMEKCIECHQTLPFC